jgi:glycerophosphoryl diester phosphodiesterase
MSRSFVLQGHRGARGLKPENTLPSFEVALDLGVSSIETDVHLTRDGVPVICHDPEVSNRLFRLAPGSASPPPAPGLLVSSLTLAQLRGYRADRNPDPARFPQQDASVTPLARLFADHMEIDPYAPPTLADLFAFVKAYAGDLGAAAGKTEQQRQRARTVNLDIELKRVPFRPERIGDRFDGSHAGLLEERVVEVLRSSGLATIRSFDHRCVLAVRRLEPHVTGAVLITGTAPVDAVQVVRQADADIYCPDMEFLDEAQVRQCRVAGIRVLPWTVNDVADMRQLIDWGVDGITTDYPDRLGESLRQAGIEYR